jgi:hypothetical protein
LVVAMMTVYTGVWSSNSGRRSTNLARLIIQPPPPPTPPLLPGPSHERRYLAFSLFQLLLPHLTTADVPAVFSRAFLQVGSPLGGRPDMRSAAPLALLGTAACAKGSGGSPSRLVSRWYPAGVCVC